MFQVDFVYLEGLHHLPLSIIDFLLHLDSVRPLRLWLHGVVTKHINILQALDTINLGVQRTDGCFDNHCISFGSIGLSAFTSSIFDLVFRR